MTAEDRKASRKAYMKVWRALHRDERNAYKRAHRAARNEKEGVPPRAPGNWTDKEWRKAYAKEYRARTRESRNAAKRAYRATPKGREYHKRYNSEYAKLHKEEIKAWRKTSPSAIENRKRSRRKYRLSKRVPRMLRILLAVSSLAEPKVP